MKRDRGGTGVRGANRPGTGALSHHSEQQDKVHGNRSNQQSHASPGKEHHFFAQSAGIRHHLLLLEGVPVCCFLYQIEAIGEGFDRAVLLCHAVREAAMGIVEGFEAAFDGGKLFSGGRGDDTGSQ